MVALSEPAAAITIRNCEVETTRLARESSGRGENLLLLALDGCPLALARDMQSGQQLPFWKHVL